MEINKPKFWDNKIGLKSIILLPISLIYNFLILLKKKITITKKIDLPIICVGNIYIGGTGKTPTSLLLSNELEKLGRSPAIIRKLYKNHSDEYNLIRNYTEKLIIKKTRVEGVLEAKRLNYDLAILDDGFQDYSIKKDLSIICFNSQQLIGNGLVLPSGPLRENLSSLKKANIIIINGSKNKNFEEKLLNINKNLKIFYSFYKPLNLEQFKDKNLLAIAGIGNPNNFFKLIEENNLKIGKKIIYPDHYSFSRSEIQSFVNKAEENNYQIIMTEKDYYKISHLGFREINYLRVELIIDNIDKLADELNKV